MRIGCCTSWERVDKLVEIGYDYVELSLADLASLPEDEFETIVKRVEASGIRCETTNNFIPKTVRITGPDVNQEQVDEYIDKALSRAGRLGVKHVVFGSGGAKNIPEGFPREQGYEQLVWQTKRISDTARKYGVAITIEPLRKAECNIINTFAEGCELAKDVDRDNIRVLVDFYHFAQENEPVQNIINGGEYLSHVHFAREEGRVYPCSLSEDDRYEPFFNALRTVGYNQRISVEAGTDDFEKDAPVALSFFRDYFSN